VSLGHHEKIDITAGEKPNLPMITFRFDIGYSGWWSIDLGRATGFPVMATVTFFFAEPHPVEFLSSSHDLVHGGALRHPSRIRNVQRYCKFWKASVQFRWSSFQMPPSKRSIPSSPPVFIIPEMFGMAAGKWHPEA
jgi:hypothetical protein